MLLFANAVNSQITKNNWLVGGNGRFSSQIEDLNGIDVRGLTIGVSPIVGYFFIDKFAGGIRSSLDYNKIKFNGGTSKSTQIGIGPFLRYYFLNPSNRINILTETSYQYQHLNSNNGSDPEKNNVFTFSAGPVIYFNTSVGIEFLLNYEIFNNKGSTTSAKTFYLNIGFQIHLEKDK